jgi:dTDP-4-amino-4,6-dideoxygalactose transaminase
MTTIPFNRPMVTGEELSLLTRVVENGAFSGGGEYSQACEALLEKAVGCGKAILTSSGTDALEMCALLLEVGPGDEVIMPSYTFVSTASAFALRGAEIVWCDIRKDTKNLDETRVESLVTPRTRAVVAVHYGGVACEMDVLADICRRREISLVEDAAQAVGCAYRQKPLGGFGDLAVLSFHDTKNVQCGEGGALLVNHPRFAERAEIVRDKGTDRTRFLKGLVDKYTWVDLGSSFLMSDLSAAFLFPQLERAAQINARRRHLWSLYERRLAGLPERRRQAVPAHCAHNGHLFYVQCDSLDEREALADFLKDRGIDAYFHYTPLHRAPFWKGKYDNLFLPVTDHAADGVLRMPLFYDLKESEVEAVCAAVMEFFSEEVAR